MADALADQMRQVSAECRAAAGLILTDLGKFPTKDEVEKHVGEVHLHCDALDALADEAEKRHVTVAEYEEISARLAAIGSHPVGETFEHLKQEFAKRGKPWR